MAVVDMPLEELKKYKGISPLPSDLNEFWDKQLAELSLVDANVELIKADFQAPNVECFEMRFTSSRGARIFAKVARAKDISKPLPAILEFHGYAGQSRDFSGLLDRAANGFVVAAMDCRGQDGKSQDVGQFDGSTFNGHLVRGLGDSPDTLMFKELFLDTAQLAKVMMAFDWVDENKVASFGISQGGALALACAALEPNIKQCAALYPFLGDFKGVFELDIDGSSYGELKEHFRRYDPHHINKDKIFETLGYIDLSHLGARIKADVLMLTGLKDIHCPPSTQFAIYNNLTCKKEMILYHDFGHETLPKSMDEILKFHFKLL